MKAMIGLFQEQTVKLLVTPQMKQSLYILQCSSLELTEHISQQVLQNPLLSMPPDPFKSSTVSLTVSALRSAEVSNPIEQLVSSQQTLEHFLREQLSLLPYIPPITLTIAKFIIGSLDDNGYLDMPMDHIASHLQVEAEQVRHALELVQTLEPSGIAARSLRECLMLQLERSGKKSSLAYRIVSDYLNDLAERKFEHMARVLMVELDHIHEAADQIRLLNPKPGASFQQIQQDVIVPDLMVSKQNDDYVVAVNDSLLPRLRISPAYRNTSLYQNGEAKKYIKTQWKEAARLIDSVEQRRITLYRVMEAIVQKQRSFLEKGEIALQPLTRKEIADQLGVHESTVSRATANKYVLTPRGTFALKAFFSSSVGTAEGYAASSESIKQRIKLLVQQEKGCNPLSDQQIAKLLEREGICISRRTVTKYREALGIPTSSGRRRS